MLVHDRKVFDSIKNENIKRISELKSIFVGSFDDSDHQQMLMAGIRFKDDENIFALTCGNVMEYLNHLNKEKRFPTTEHEALEFMQTLDRQELDQFLIDAMREAASSDYWYKYEKDWGSD